MSKFAYDEFKWDARISADDDTVDRFLYEGMYVEAPSISDLNTAIEWLALYGAEDTHIAEPYANVIAFLAKTIEEKESRRALAEAKRTYARENGIPVSQVRVTRQKAT